MMGKSNVAEKIYTLMASANRNLFGMDLQTQFIAKKIPNGFNKAFQVHSITGDYNEIVCIPNVITNEQIMLQELVELIHVDIGEKLGSEIADRQSLPVKKVCPGGGKTLDDLAK